MLGQRSLDGKLLRINIKGGGDSGLTNLTGFLSKAGHSDQTSHGTLRKASTGAYP